MKIEIPRKNKHCFTLLEFMIVIAIVAIAGGAIFWRLGFLLQSQRKESDHARFRELLLSSHMLAINTKSDLELEIRKVPEGWFFRLIAIEELGKQISCGKLAPLNLQFEELFEEKKSDNTKITFRFFSTGHVTPFGRVKIEKEQIDIPAFFHQEEGKELGPIHPDNEKK